MSVKMNPPPIKNFEELIEPELNGGKVMSYESYFFTEPGDNYGSTMLGVKTKVKDPDNKIRDLEVVAKLLPGNEFFIKLFKPERTFRTENSCYTIVAPALIELQKAANIPDQKITNVFAKCYGARISLDKNSSKVDSDAALILENLCDRGYKIGDRIKGFDYETTLVVLRDMARFHAMPIVIRRLNPKMFNEKFRPFLKAFYPDKDFDDEARFAMSEDNLKMIKNIPGITDDLIEKIIKLFALHEERVQAEEEYPDTIFSTITHNDFWVNNMMISYDVNGKPRDMKIVDFQIAQYNSLMHDVVFFIMLNVEMKILKEKFDDLLKEYYKHFIQCLTDLNSPTDEYSYQKFLSEFHRIGPLQLHHILTLLRVINMKRGSIPDLQDMDQSTILGEDKFDSSYFNKLKLIIELFEEKGLL